MTFGFSRLQRIALLVLSVSFLIGAGLWLQKRYATRLEPELIFRTEFVTPGPTPAVTPETTEVLPPQFQLGEKLNLNTATPEQLAALPGIGPVLAGRIVTWRQQEGPFRKVGDLLRVPGIGRKKLQQIASLVEIKQ